MIFEIIYENISIGNCVNLIVHFVTTNLFMHSSVLTNQKRDILLSIELASIKNTTIIFVFSLQNFA